MGHPDDHMHMGFGKHYTETYKYVYETDPSYVNWALNVRDPTGPLLNFAKYCRARENEAPAVTLNTPPRQSQTQRTYICPVHRCAMGGPFTSRNGYVHNRGRQFYTCKYKGPMGRQHREEDNEEVDCGIDGFKWADGTNAVSAASCFRAACFHGISPGTVGIGLAIGGGLDLVANGMGAGPSGFRDPNRGGVPVGVSGVQSSKKRLERDFDAAAAGSPDMVNGHKTARKAAGAGKKAATTQSRASSGDKTHSKDVKIKADVKKENTSSRQ